jgi:hypothetical protein
VRPRRLRSAGGTSRLGETLQCTTHAIGARRPTNSRTRGLAISLRKTSERFAPFLGVVVMMFLGLAHAPTATAAADPDRCLAHSVFLGVGATWTESGRFRQTVYPGAMLGFDVALGRNVAFGLNADFTYIDERPEGPPPVSTNHRLISGLDLKLLPLSSGRVRPWVTVSAAGSVVHDTGYGYGLGRAPLPLRRRGAAFLRAGHGLVASMCSSAPIGLLLRGLVLGVPRVGA